MMVPITNLDMRVNLFGDMIFAPILVGPALGQQRFHADGELAMVRGASAAKAPHGGERPLQYSHPENRR